MKQEYLRKWRIIEMELWDQAFVDLVVQGYIDIRAKGHSMWKDDRR